MKRKVLTYAAASAVGLSLLGAGVASAHGMFGFAPTLTAEQIATNQQTMFQKEAELLGISVDAIKTGWAQGQSVKEIAAANGISEDQLKLKMQAAADAAIKTRLQALVDKGVITQDQMNQRLTFMQAQQSKMKGGKGRMGRGFGFF